MVNFTPNKTLIYPFSYGETLYLTTSLTISFLHPSFPTLGSVTPVTRFWSVSFFGLTIETIKTLRVFSEDCIYS